MFIKTLESICASGKTQAVACIGPHETIMEQISLWLSERLNYQNSHPDVIFLEPELPQASIKIDQVRDLIDRLSVRPFYGTYYVILPKAGSINEACYNALLKTLEEPKRTWFFLIFDHVDEIPSTIKSRCLTVQHSIMQPTDERVLALMTELENMTTTTALCQLADQWALKVDSVDAWLSLLWKALADHLQAQYFKKELDFNYIRRVERYGDMLLELKTKQQEGSIQLKRCIDQMFIIWMFR